MRISPILVLLGLAVPCLCAEPVSAPIAQSVMLTEEKQNGLTVIRMENERVALTITPSRGGAVTEYSDKLAPGNVILPNRGWGLFIDHFQEQPWPGELLEKPYEFQIVTQTPQEATVKVWTTATGLAPHNTIVNAKLAGIVLEKSYTLKAGSPVLSVDVKLTAPADAAKTCAYWIQHVFRAGKEYDATADRTFRPATRGIRANGKEGNGFYGQEDFIGDLVAPWIALLDTAEKRGLVSLTDYNDVDRLYACGGNTTSELMFNTCYIPKGTSKSYRCQLLPLAGFDRLTHADGHFLAAMKIRTDNKGGGVAEFAAVRADQPVTELTLAVTAVAAATPGAKAVDCGSVTLADLGDAPRSATLELKNLPADPVVLRVAATGKTADGKAFAAAFEDFHAGAYQWGENILTDMRTPLYAAPRPPKKLTLAKPAALKLAPAHQGGGKVLFFQGLLDEEYGVANAIHSTGINTLENKPLTTSYYRYASQFFGSLTDFPYDYEELFKHSCIILGGASASAFKPIGVEMLHDYLQAGGGLIVLGSYGAYGRSHLAGTTFGDALPFAFSANPSALTGPVARRVTVAPDLPAFAGSAATLAQNASCWWTHPVTLKPGAKPLLLADGAPVMAAWEYGPNKARIVCIAAAPMGDPNKGDAPFWKDPNWPILLRDAIWWVQKQDRRFE